MTKDQGTSVKIKFSQVNCEIPFANIIVLVPKFAGIGSMED
ncbi:hypothetical protein GCM10023142_22540 [Anaerocolumna aminovalerica]|nr:hypothetical protein [Anaerocolumna aminovalerica]MDU6264039.1 hypothetical protein [Anaerocolumna aminovalerica]